MSFHFPCTVVLQFFTIMLPIDACHSLTDPIVNHSTWYYSLSRKTDNANILCSHTLLQETQVLHNLSFNKIDNVSYWIVVRLINMCTCHRKCCLAFNWWYLLLKAVDNSRNLVLGIMMYMANHSAILCLIFLRHWHTRFQSRRLHLSPTMSWASKRVLCFLQLLSLILFSIFSFYRWACHYEPFPNRLS